MEPCMSAEYWLHYYDNLNESRQPGQRVHIKVPIQGDDVVTIQLSMQTIMDAVRSTNYGTHRFLAALCQETNNSLLRAHLTELFQQGIVYDK